MFYAIMHAWLMSLRTPGFVILRSVRSDDIDLLESSGDRITVVSVLPNYL